MKKGKNYSVSIVIPCFNEEGNVVECVKQAPRLGKFTEIIIVDDGSTDRTSDYALALKKRRKNLKVISYQPNRGKVFAVKAGFDAARGDILMIWDADRTVPAKELQRFYDLLIRGRAEFANGTRMTYPMEKQAMRTANYFGNILFGRVWSWVLGLPVTDTLCGTKALFKRDYKKIKLGTEPWGDFDLLFGAKKLGLRVSEVPVHYKARVAGRSKMKAFQYGMVVLSMLLRGFWIFKIKPVFKRV